MGKIRTKDAVFGRLYLHSLHGKVRCIFRSKTRTGFITKYGEVFFIRANRSSKIIQLIETDKEKQL